jgi:hypothetical protein
MPRAPSRRARPLLAECITHNFADDGDEIARFLLLCRPLVYSEDNENLLSVVEQVAAPLLMEFDPMIEEAGARVLASLHDGPPAEE